MHTCPLIFTREIIHYLRRFGDKKKKDIHKIILISFQRRNASIIKKRKKFKMSYQATSLLLLLLFKVSKFNNYFTMLSRVKGAQCTVTSF
jgi:hypothetical protein